MLNKLLVYHPDFFINDVLQALPSVKRERLLLHEIKKSQGNAHYIKLML